ncbi:MAG: ABC transporter permease [Methanocellales archaeon]
MNLKSYILRRILYSIFIAFGILTITFIIVRSGPLSPVNKYLASLGARGTPEEIISAVEAKYGLNRPIWEQYIDYILSLLKGDFGWSFSTSMPVIELIKIHWIYSFQLVAISTVLAIVLGILIGVYSAKKQYSKVDYLASFFSYIGISIPSFWLGIMLILIFSVKLGWFKTYYDTTLPILSLQNLKALLLPVITLSTGAIASYSRYVRASMLDSLRQDFVKFARSKGLSERTVIFKHVLRNALLPVITVIMFDLGTMVFAGAYFTEIIFGIPGLGWISFNAIFSGDYAIVVAVTVISAFIILLANLAADIAYTYIDPRVRYD